MKIYILASFKMYPADHRIKALVDWLNEGLKRFAEDGHFLNVTSSDASFLNDARRLVKGDLPPTFNSSWSKNHPEKSKNGRKKKT